MMLLGYNSKVYIRDVIKDLKEDLEENNIYVDIECIDKKKDIFEVIEGKISYTIALDDITNKDDYYIQVLSLRNINNSSSPFIYFIISNDNIEILHRDEDKMLFYLKDDKIYSE